MVVKETLFMNMKDSTLRHLDELITRYPILETLRESILKASQMICECHLAGGKVLVCGNGGSASDSEHIVGELMKGFILRRELPGTDVEKLKASGIEDWKETASNLQQGIKAVSLTGHAALSTAVLNDNDPYFAFAQQVYVLGNPGDVLIGLSTSGNSRNVVNAVKVAKAFGVKTIGFTGSRPSKMEDLCDLIVKVPETETFKVQEYHLPIYHTICLMVENEIFGE